MLTDQEMYDRMRNGWRMGGAFTVCGNGSLPHATVGVRSALPHWCEKYGLRIVNDAGAGDLQWKVGMEWDVDYRPFDLIPRRPQVTQIDITRDVMPVADLILCRMVLNHLDDERVGMALERFKQSARYLAATQFDGENLPQRSPQFKRLDLKNWLGKPIESEPDGTEPECRIALWKL